MLDVEWSLRNYRCFGDEPSSIRITNGFTSLVGTNNSGKSTLLRSLYECRTLFGTLSSAPNQPQVARLASAEADARLWNVTAQIGERVHRSGSGAPIEVGLTVHDSDAGRFEVDGQLATLTIALSRDGLSRPAIHTVSGIQIGPGHGRTVNIGPIVEAAAILNDSFYIGPFRHIVNAASSTQYYDIQVGSAFVNQFAELTPGGGAEQNEAMYAMIQQVARIFGFSSLDINPTPDNSTLQLTIDGRSYRLGEIGAGFSHFIVVLVNTLVRRPSVLRR